MSASNRAALITPPVVGRNIWGFDSDDFGTATWFAIPESWKGAIMELEADGDDFYFAIGENVTTVDPAAKSTVSGNAITAQGSVAGHVKDGTKISVDFSMVQREICLRMALVSANDTAGLILRVTRASGTVER